MSTTSARAIVFMVSLPLDANIQFLTMMATKMPFVGGGDSSAQCATRGDGSSAPTRPIVRAACTTMGFATRSTHPTRYALQFGGAWQDVSALAFPNRSGEHRIEIRGAQTRAGLMRLRLTERSASGRA